MWYEDHMFTLILIYPLKDIKYDCALSQRMSVVLVYVYFKYI